MKPYKRMMLEITILIGCAILVCFLSTAYSRPHGLHESSSYRLQDLFQSNDANELNKSFQHALHEILKLLLAAALGIIVAIVHKRTMKVRSINVSLEQAEILLCVSGALMVIIIGNSLARAFGLVGAAAFIRFRTPMKDPKDTTVLFLLVGIGMSCGLGLYAIAILASLFLVIFLWLLHMFGSKENNERLLVLEVMASDFNKPHALIQKVLAKHNVNYEILKIKREATSMFQYEVSLNPEQSIEKLGDEILVGGADAIKSISWEVRQKP